MKFLLRLIRMTLLIVIPIAVIAAAVGIAQQIIANKPQAQRQQPPPIIAAVAATRLKLQDYQVSVRTQGTIKPRTETTLIPQVAGTIVEVSANFQEGGFFVQGEILLRVDPRDYEIAVTIAEAEVAQARARLEEELAVAEVAEREWKQLRRKSSSASRLALRKPQVAAVRASVASAEAQLARARLNLERTQIAAPYAGRVLQKNVDIGQYVSSGTVLSRIYAADYVEVELPLSGRQLEFLTLPDQAAAEQLPEVILHSKIGSKDYRWQGRIVRTMGTLDTQSRQLFVVAQVDDPFARDKTDQPPLRIGQYVEAEIKGTLLQNVFLVPRAALVTGDKVFIVGPDQRLEQRAVEIIWRDEQQVVVNNGLNVGEALTLTALSGAAQGRLVAATIDGVAPAGKKRQRPERLAATSGKQQPAVDNPDQPGKSGEAADLLKPASVEKDKNPRLVANKPQPDTTTNFQLVP